MTLSISDDERRLLSLFRSLSSEHDRSHLLQSLTSQLLEELFPDRSVYDFMPHAAGIEPKGNVDDTSSIAHIIYCGINATGDPSETLMGSSASDEGEAIASFAHGASNAATMQGSFFTYDSTFARDYIREWRWDIVTAIARKRREVNDGAAAEVI